MHHLLSRFEASVAKTPDRPAACDQSLVLDYKSFRAIACGLASQINAQTIAPRVGILAPTSTACAAAIFACWYAGKTPVPLNFFLAPAELGKIVRDAGFDLIITIEHFLPQVQATGLKTIVLNAKTMVPGQLAAPAAGPSDTAAFIYTSGTTGEPKGVVLTFDNLVSNALAAMAQAKITPDQTFLSVLPQFHSFGLTALTVLPLMIGATVWFLPRFSPAAVVNLIHEKQITIFIAVASMFAAMAKMRSADASQLASLTLAVSGGEPLSLKVAELFKQKFNIDLQEGYGMTESAPVVSLNVPWKRKLGSVGTALPGIEVYAVDAHGQRLGANLEGELVIRGPNVMAGYHNKPDATAACIRDGGLHSGDIGKVDEEGFIYITGRAKEMIIVGGENVFPREIEDVVAQHPAVAEVAVIGVRDDLRGELPVAFVILHDGATADENDIRTFCRDKLAGYKVPRDVKIATDLPRGPTGKILKRALKVD